MVVRFISSFGLLLSVVVAAAQPSAFLYQGQLLENGVRTSGLYDMTFRLVDQPTGGSVVGAQVVTNAVAVTNGLFSVALDFGSAALRQAPLWLEILVSKTGGPGGWTALAPRQQLLSTPYAVHAGSAVAYNGGVADSQLSTNVALRNANQTFSGTAQFASAQGTFTGTFIGNGAGLTNITGSGTGGGIGAAFSGRASQLPTSPNTVFAAVSGLSDCAGSEDSMTTLSPGQNATARNLSVRLNQAPGTGRSLTFTLRINNADTALSCTIGDSSTVGTSGGAVVPVPAGSVLSLRIDSVGAPNSIYAMFGWLLQ